MPWIELIKGFRWWQGPMTPELERDTSERLSRPPINLVTRNGGHARSAGRGGVPLRPASSASTEVGFTWSRSRSSIPTTSRLGIIYSINET